MAETAYVLARNYRKTRDPFLAFLALVHESLGFEWFGGELRCPHYGLAKTRVLEIRSSTGGVLRVVSCNYCDIGA